jgi:hypothetical protein
MNEKLRAYIENLFSDAPKTKKTVELKEEILQNLIDKYNDLLAEGKSEDAAYNIAVASVGDISGLIEEVNKTGNQEETEKQRQRSALLVSLGVALAIAAFIPLFIFENDDIGFIFMFFFWAIAAGLFVYNGMTKPKYNKLDDTLVEEFKEWKANSSDKNSSFGLFSLALWLITIALYMVISFASGAWHISWIIFLIAAAVNSLIKAVFDMKKK